MVKNTLLDFLEQIFCSLLQNVALDGDFLKVCSWLYCCPINPGLENNHDVFVFTNSSFYKTALINMVVAHTLGFL